ncbi:alkaline phosphatase isoform X2 [Eupeodes corollae]|uniref:alkaline phosphatase isoform X2 n=1 Tax=Eupeodes corollae TaxID=290404 RepID=UPI002491AA75|nr:alkaline phosphatase isoform X2 [Eupeodes corollae]
MNGLLTIIVGLVLGILANNVVLSDEFHHPTNYRVKRNALPTEDGMETASFWLQDAQKDLKEKLKFNLNKEKAKNIIFFLGDGMSIDTVSAGRIFSGQLEGKLGERSKLSFEKFPIVGLSKTFCVDRQVADSACTSTAYLCGIKANYATIGVTANVTLNDCQAGQDPANQVESIAGWAQRAKKATGFVTTTTVTNASPAGLFAHVGHRDYESDFQVMQQNQDPHNCRDIADQLVNDDVGKKFNVILGGGTRRFLPNGTLDFNGNSGERLDGRNLIKEWLETKKGSAKTVFDRDQLLSVDYDRTDYLLGLFSPNEMAYKTDANSTKDPSLEEMTEAAIKMLESNKNGYFLFVEGARIDHGHHQNLAHKALMETVELSKAVQKAVDITDAADTLIVVSSDHGHTMTISGYPTIGNNILGLNTEPSDVDGLPYTTLSYANGPSYNQHFNNKKTRLDLREVDVLNKEYKYASTVPQVDETHGGGDVAVFANGPWAHLFSGVVEQNILPHIMAYAACIGDGLTMCQE